MVPIYKVEAYLARCIESILEQDYGAIELVLVDDGSPDGCATICDGYADKFLSVTVVHKPNGGLASARNAGMRVTTGEYLFFVDSDDWIDSDCISDLVEISKREEVDFVRTRGKYANWPNHPDGAVCDFGIETMMHTGRYDRGRIEEAVLPICIATPKITFGPIVSAWGTLYKTTLLTDNQIEFYEDVKYSEDCIFNAQVLMIADSFYYENERQYYNYYFNSASITKSYRADRWQSNKNLIRRFEQDFGEETRFYIPQQLWHKRLFCILSSLGERHNLKSLPAKVSFCSKICNDELTKEAVRHLDGLDISWKLHVILLLIKSRMALPLALIG